MKLTDAMIQQAEEIAADAGYAAAGVRVQDVPFAIGPMSHKSHVWDDGDDTGEELPGVCAMRWDRIREAQQNGYYFGDYAAVIAGDSYEYGEDSGEIIIHDPVVIAILA